MKRRRRMLTFTPAGAQLAWAPQLLDKPCRRSIDASARTGSLHAAGVKSPPTRLPICPPWVPICSHICSKNPAEEPQSEEEEEVQGWAYLSEAAEEQLNEAEGKGSKGCSSLVPAQWAQGEAGEERGGWSCEEGEASHGEQRRRVWSVERKRGRREETQRLWRHRGDERCWRRPFSGQCHPSSSSWTRLCTLLPPTDMAPPPQLLLLLFLFVLFLRAERDAGRRRSLQAPTSV